MLTTYFTPNSLLNGSLVVLLIVAAIVGGRFAHSHLIAKGRQPGQPVPYTVTLSETTYTPDGLSHPGVEVTVAARSDGSVVWRASSGRGLATRIIQFVSGTEVTFDEIRGVQSTMAKQFTAASLHRDPASRCVNSLAGASFTSPAELFTGEENVSGYRTAKLLRGNATRWFALDYGCAMVQERMDWGADGFAEKTLVGLRPGQPDDWLFATGGSEVPPSTRRSARAASGRENE